MKIEDFIKKEAVLDLSFFNFSNAITAAYFASNDLEVLRVNQNFKTFFQHEYKTKVLTWLD